MIEIRTLHCRLARGCASAGRNVAQSYRASQIRIATHPASAINIAPLVVVDQSLVGSSRRMIQPGLTPIGIQKDHSMRPTLHREAERAVIQIRVVYSRLARLS
jgi:hypothetical protein